MSRVRWEEVDREAKHNITPDRLSRPNQTRKDRRELWIVNRSGPIRLMGECSRCWFPRYPRFSSCEVPERAACQRLGHRALHPLPKYVRAFGPHPDWFVPVDDGLDIQAWPPKNIMTP